MTRIYTRTGDAGETGLAGGQRRPKWDPRIEALGTVDELNCLLGLVRAQGLATDLDALLEGVQNDLFDLGAALADPGSQPWNGERISALEAAIDHLESGLPPLDTFILPGGTEAAARCHLARAVCRRAERRLFRLASQEGLHSVLTIYLNRLSDLLFLLARTLNRRDGREETPWRGPP